MKKVKRFGPMSLAKISAVTYGLLGLIGGVIMFFVLLVSMLVATEDMGAAWIGALAVLILVPIIYGAIGFVTGYISAWIFNKATKWVGGLEVEFED
ncbi:MAG: hypothetical protein NUV82_02805 [Candidatus Komeilibacteria bacterium]|nr:hypothetical protein [Candidatus Komeilibacteria bacterium]